MGDRMRAPEAGVEGANPAIGNYRHNELGVRFQTESKMTKLHISLATALLYFFSYSQTLKVGPTIPEGWKMIEADKFMTFYLPDGMRLVSEERCVECAWGSTYSNDRIRLYAEYTSWNSEYAAHYLAKQADYLKEMTTIDGNRAKIQSWRLEQAVDGFNLYTEVRIYDPSGKLKARMSALCIESIDIETAKKIYTTIQFR
jgi:hypothetical protein